MRGGVKRPVCGFPCKQDLELQRRVGLGWVPGVGHKPHMLLPKHRAKNQKDRNQQEKDKKIQGPTQKPTIQPEIQKKKKEKKKNHGEVIQEHPRRVNM